MFRIDSTNAYTNSFRIFVFLKLELAKSDGDVLEVEIGGNVFSAVKLIMSIQELLASVIVPVGIHRDRYFQGKDIFTDEFGPVDTPGSFDDVFEMSRSMAVSILAIVGTYINSYNGKIMDGNVLDDVKLD